MNFLPHKSWNVYGAKNRARVQRDEAAQAEEVDARETRARQAHQHVRLDRLRRRAQDKYATLERLQDVVSLPLPPVGEVATPKGETTWLGPLGKPQMKTVRHSERPCRPRPSDEPERGISLNPYAGTSRKQRHCTIVHHHRSEAVGPSRDHIDGGIELELDAKRREDPLYGIGRQLAKRSARMPLVPHASPQPLAASLHTPAPTDHDRLRQARLRREAAEHERTQRLLAARGRLATPTLVDTDRQGYSDQFHPEFTRAAAKRRRH